ncbi:MAG: MFS transporter [Gordonia sp. (in: high G+C Gram-positive bacteria)]
MFALYCILGQGQSPLVAGISVTGVALATAATAPLTGFWVDRTGPAPAALTGGALAALSVPAIATVAADPSPWTLQPLLITFGVAISLVSMPAGIAAYRAVTESELPDAITHINILQRIGGSLGGAICAVLVAGSGADIDTGLRHGFYALGVAAVGALVGAILIARETHVRPTQPECSRGAQMTDLHANDRHSQA